MKKLIHNEYGFELILDENKVNVLTVENQVVLSKLISELDAQCMGEEGPFILSEVICFFEFKIVFK